MASCSLFALAGAHAFRWEIDARLMKKLGNFFSSRGSAKETQSSREIKTECAKMMDFHFVTRGN